MKSIQSWKTIRRLRGAVGSAVAVAFAGLAFGEEAQAQDGYNLSGTDAVFSAQAGMGGSTLEGLLGLGSTDLTGLDDQLGDSPFEGSAIQRNLTVAAGDTISFDYNFISEEGQDALQGVNDLAFFAVDSNASVIADTFDPLGATSFAFPVVQANPAGETGYQSFEITFTTAGTFAISIGVIDGSDPIIASFLALDNVRLISGETITLIDDFESGLGGWTTVGDVVIDPGSFGITPPNGSQALLSTASIDRNPPVCSTERFEDAGTVTFQITATDNQLETDTGIVSFELSDRSVNTVLDLGDFEGPALEATIDAAPDDPSLPYIADVIATDEDGNQCQVTIGAIPQFGPVIFPTTDGAEAVDIYSGSDGEAGPHTFAFLAAHTDGVYVLDVSDPSSIVVLGVYNPGTCFAEGVEVVFDAEDVTYVDEQHALYVSAAACGMHFVKADPNEPMAVDFLQLIGIHDTPVWAQGSAYVTLEGQFLTFVADHNSLEILDTTNLAAPFLLSSVGVVAFAEDLFGNDEVIVVEVASAVVDGEIFAGIATDDGMRAVQITSTEDPEITPMNPVISGRFVTLPEFGDLQISQDIAGIADPETGEVVGIALPRWAAGIQFLGIDFDPEGNLSLVHHEPASNDTAYFSAIAYNGDVFATEGTEGLRRFRIDLENLIMPVSLDPTTTPVGDGVGTDWAWDIKVSECVSYTTFLDTDDDSGGLQLNSLADCLPTFLLLEAFAEEEADDDGDGVFNSEDNCTAVANPDQLDSDADGYGNACDADFNNDGMVGVPDFALLSAQFGSTTGGSADFNGDTIVGIPDFAALSGMFGSPPGPSGLSCAGTVPCP